MNVTKEFGGGCLIGAPIIFEDGRTFGTLCGMDNKPFDFQKQDIELFTNMAELITYILELDDSCNQILTLSAPLVPVCKGVGVIPIIGRIGSDRAQYIVTSTLTKSQKHNLEYLIIDVSGITDINNEEVMSLLSLVKMLNLLGIEPVITGMRPDLAKKVHFENEEIKKIKFTHNLESALSLIGITLSRKK